MGKIVHYKFNRQDLLNLALIDWKVYHQSIESSFLPYPGIPRISPLPFYRIQSQEIPISVRKELSLPNEGLISLLSKTSRYRSSIS